MQTLILNGRIINADSEANQDIRFANGKIIQLGKGLRPIQGERVLDASGCYVIPGAIDPHVHMELPTANGTSSDDFFTGSVAALAGGTTTLIDFVTPQKGQSLADAILLRKIEALKSVTDHSFHVSPVEWTTSSRNEILDCIRKEGLRSFKAYMAYKSSIGLDDDELKRVMEVVAEEKAVLAVHCELGDEIEALKNKYAENGQLQPIYHARSRPEELEAGAVERLVNLVAETGCTVYVVHVSSALTLEIIKRARQNGLPVFAETCPQYLMLDESMMMQETDEAVKYIMSPPLRTTHDNQALWQALSTGLIQSVGTDHCPFTLNQKLKGRDDFRKIPGGIGGVEHRLSLLFTFGVLKGLFSLNRFVELVSTNPAKIFGLYPAKGLIAEGSDADIVIWDPDKRSNISVRDHYQNCDHNVYEGIEVSGKPKWVISGGKVLVDQGVLNLKGIKGRFLQTNPS